MKGRLTDAGATIEMLEPRWLLSSSVTVENLAAPPASGDPPIGSENADVCDVTLGGDQYVWYNSNYRDTAFTIKVNKKGRAADAVPDLAIEADVIGAVAAGPDGYTYLNTAVLFDDIRPG